VARAAKRRPATAPPPLEYRMLLTATLCLLAGGAVMVYSASSARDLLAGHGDGTGYLERYVAYGAIGLVAMRFLSRRGVEAAVLVPVDQWRRLELAARPTLKDLLLAESPRAEIPVPPRRDWHRRAPAAFE